AHAALDGKPGTARPAARRRHDPHGGNQDLPLVPGARGVERHHVRSYTRQNCVGGSGIRRPRAGLLGIIGKALTNGFRPHHHNQPSTSTANVARVTTGINGQAERPPPRSGPATTASSLATV